ncbi:MAG: hypothetical protein QXN04_09350 [Pyrobaculum sp.]
MEDLSKWAGDLIRRATNGHDSSDKYIKYIRDVKRLIDYMEKIKLIADREYISYREFYNLIKGSIERMIVEWGWSIDDVLEWLNEIVQTYDEFRNKNRGTLGGNKFPIFFSLMRIKAYAMELGVSQLYDEIKETVLKELFDEKKEVGFVKAWVEEVRRYLEEEIVRKRRSTSRETDELPTILETDDRPTRVR